MSKRNLDALGPSKSAARCASLRDYFAASAMQGIVFSLSILTPATNKKEPQPHD